MSEILMSEKGVKTYQTYQYFYEELTFYKISIDFRNLFKTKLFLSCFLI